MYVYRNVYIDIQISVSACPLMHRNIYIAIYTCACGYVCVRVDIYGEDEEERRKKHSADVAGEVGGWGRDPFSRNFMKPTPRRKWYLTTGRRFH